MTSVAANASQAQSGAPQQPPSSTTSGSNTHQSAPSAAAAGRSYAGANTPFDRKSSGSSTHAKSTSIPPAVPSLGGPTIANGNAAVGPTAGAHHHHSHARKPSVTISAAGNSGQMPNGGPTVGQTPTGNGIQFGSMNNASQSPAQNMATPQQDGASLAVNAPSHPRSASPANPPSPIPQPPASGGRPPQSSLHQSTNSLSFGTFPNDDNQRRSSVQGSGTPNMQHAHIRRDSNSNHSQHDVNMTPGGAGRGGYPQGGRGGRGYPGGFNQQMPHSPSAAFRNLPPNGPRGPAGPAMGAQFAGRGGAGPYGAPYSPAGRSPSLAHAQPVPPHASQMPMQTPGMPQPYNYGAGYGAPPNVKTSSFPSNSKSFRGKPGKSFRGGRKRRGFSAVGNDAASSTPSSLPAQSLQFAMFPSPPMQGHYDPAQGYYPGNYMPNQMQNMPYAPQNGYMASPNSPRPYYQQQGSNYMGGQYSQPQPPSMSRQGSHLSERPVSTMSQQQQQPPMTPGHQHTSSRGTGSPGPKSTFQVPPKPKSSAIKITNPNTGEQVKFDKGSAASPAPAPASAKAPESTPTPPPRTPSAQHNRTDSRHKTDQEVRNDLREQIQAKIKADQEAAAQKLKEEEEAKKRKEKEEEERAEAARKAEEEEKKAAEERAAKEAQEAKLAAERAMEAEKKKAEQEAAAQKKIEEEKERAAAAAAAESKPKQISAGDEPKAPEMPDLNASDADWDEYEKQMAAYEAVQEAAYQKKKAAKKQEDDAKAADKAAKLDEELRRQEEEAERLEAEKERKRKAGEGDSSKLEAFEALKKSDNAFQATKTSSEGAPEHGSAPDSGTDTPKSDAAAMPPPSSSRPGPKQKPAALKLETQKPVEAAQPSAALQSLMSARKLTTFGADMYPSGIASPNPALNTSAKGSFRYDKDFLLQFQKVFTEKPSENWQEKLKETVGDTNETPGSARGSRSSIGGRSVSQRGGVPGAFAGGMGNFGNSRTLPAGTTSAERFAAASRPGAPPGGAIRYDPKAGFPGGFPVAITRQGSNSLVSPRPNPSDRGSRRGNNSKAGGKRNDAADAKNMPLTAGMEIKPIEVSASGWKPTSLVKGPTAGPPPGGENGYLAPDVVQRKVKSALNKMTPTTFEKISGQILDIVMQSKKETDGRTLRQVIQLTFEKATDEAHWAEMYAQFCGKMLSAMTPDIRDETLPKDKNGNVVNGSTLFRKYLLNRCQQDFEQGWQSKLPEKPEGGEAALLSDEYYAAAAAKRRGLGLVRFIGELFKLGMLTARIMHMCVQKLVDFEGTPDEAEIESLTSLLKTIGHDLDGDEKGHILMDVYFGKIDEMMKVPDLQSRLRFMLMDIIDLRKHGWKGKNSQQKGPSTIEQVHKEAQAAQQAQEARLAQEQQQRRGGGGGGRPGVGRGDARNFSGPPPDYNSNRVGMDDLRRLGRGSNRAQGTQGPMGPTSMFNTRGSNKRISAPGGIFANRGAEDSAASSRTATPPIKSEKERREEAEKAAAGSNAFSALAGLDSTESNDMAGSPATSPPTTKRPLPGEVGKPGPGA